MADHDGHTRGDTRTGRPRDVPFRIFLSYRREDAPPQVGRLWDALRYGAEGVGGFPKHAIFKDVDTIEPGVDFRKAIARAVQASSVFLAVIGPQWLSVANKDGVRRLDDPNDYVRLEIEAALQRAAEHSDVRVVPIRVGGAAMPTAHDLPETLRDLVHRHSIELTDAHWAYDVEQLLKWLKELADRRRRPGWRRIVGTSAERGRRAPWRRIALAAAATGVVAAMAIAVVRLTNVSGDPLTLERVRDPDFRQSHNQVMKSLIERPRSRPRYIAGGYAGTVVEREAAIWTSDDGRRWQRDLLGPLEGDQEITVVRQSENGDDGVLAIGRDDGQIAVWRSDDGRTWSEPEFAGSEDGTGEMYRLRLFNGSLLGSGWREAEGGHDAAVWNVSADGRTVDPVASDELGGPGRQHMNTIVKAAAVGALVGVGVDNENAAVWLSRNDGADWERATDETLGGDGTQAIWDATRIGTQIVAVGYERLAGKTTGMVWRSEDGETWTKGEPIEEDLRVELRRVFRLQAASSSEDPSLAAAGVVGDTAALWTSHDGTDWRREPDPSGALNGNKTEILSISANDFPRLIAVGRSESEDGVEAAVWIKAEG